MIQFSGPVHGPISLPKATAAIYGVRLCRLLDSYNEAKCDKNINKAVTAQLGLLPLSEEF